MLYPTEMQLSGSVQGGWGGILRPLTVTDINNQVSVHLLTPFYSIQALSWATRVIFSHEKVQFFFFFYKSGRRTHFARLRRPCLARPHSISLFSLTKMTKYDTYYIAYDTPCKCFSSVQRIHESCKQLKLYTLEMYILFIRENDTLHLPFGHITHRCS